MGVAESFYALHLKRNKRRCEGLPAGRITHFLEHALLAAHPAMAAPPSTPEKSTTTSTSSSNSSNDGSSKEGEPNRPFALATLRELSLRGLSVADEGARAIGACNDGIYRSRD